MLSTWIEAAAKGRHGGPVRAGLWSAVVVGTHPIESGQEVWVELEDEDGPIGPLPAYWLENKGANSLWHVPMPPRPVGRRLRYKSAARMGDGPTAFSPSQEVVVRPNLPGLCEPPTGAIGVEGLVGNRHLTVRVDSRGSTLDVIYPTTGLHSDVRPAEGDDPRSRVHFRGIEGGLAVGSRLEWFDERLSWEAEQHYEGATNVLVTALRWRFGPIRVIARDFAPTGPDLPKTANGAESPGQYVKRYRILNEGDEPRRILFGLAVRTEVNGGVGEPGLSWHDGVRALLATNRGHGHSNRKLARDATVEFAIGLDDRGEVRCETSDPSAAVIFRWLDLPAGGETAVDVLVSGAFTGWMGDQGTFEHWLRPALTWFRSTDLDRVERETSAAWDDFVEAVPRLELPRPNYAAALRRSCLAAALHADAKWGAIASAYDLGLNGYCWPRDAMFTGLALGRAGHPEIARGVLEWMFRVRAQSKPYAYWFQKYTTDGWPEWETPAVDQSATFPFALERYYRRTGDLDLVAGLWQGVEQAAAVCQGLGPHPGLRWLDDLALVSSAGIWDNRFAAFLYSNTSAVAGLRAAARIGRLLDRADKVAEWDATADRIWETGILAEPEPDDPTSPGLVDPESGRFYDCRRINTHRSLWSDRPDAILDRSLAVDVALLGPAVPFGLLPASDPRLMRTAEAILAANAVEGDPDALRCWTADPSRPESGLAPGESLQHEPSSLATLWVARYLIRLGRETGDDRHWTRAVALLNDVLARLGPLGLSLQVGPRRGDPANSRRKISGAWGLHAQLIDTLMDFDGLDYDEPDRRLSLAPSLPPDWPRIGIETKLPCGRVFYRLERSNVAEMALAVETDLGHPVTLRIDLARPGLDAPPSWRAERPGPPPAFDPARHRLSWVIEVPDGPSSFRWSWPEPHRGRH